MPTLTGLIFIPVCLIALAGGLRAQLAVFAMGSVLTSAAVVNLASFGVQPAYFMGLLLLGVATVSLLVRGGYGLDRAVLARFAPLPLLLLAALNALFWGGAVFWDEVWVVSGRQMFDLASAERYSFRPENANQLAYLVLNIAIAALLADRLVRLPAATVLRTAHCAVLAAFWLATLFVIWDWLAHRFGVYFPDAFLHSNAFYAAAHEQAFGDVARISGPFSEPSSLAYAYGGFLAYLSGLYLAERTTRALSMMFLAVAALAISTSTTAYAVLVLWLLTMAIVTPMTRPRPGRVRPGRRSRLGIALVMGLACAGVLAVARTQQDDIRQVYEDSIAGKTESGSYEDRTAADRMGYDAFAATFGLGIGLGSHRPSSLPAAMLSNVGVVGTAAFLVFVGLCLVRSGPDSVWPGGARALWPFRAFPLGLLVVHCVSSPSLNSPLLWLALTLNLAISAYRNAPDARAPGVTAACAAPNRPPRSARSSI